MLHESLPAAVEQQAAAHGHFGSPLYAALLTRIAADIRASGPCAHALADHEHVPGVAVALRLLSAIHALVLKGAAPELAAYYPSAGGHFDASRPDACWPAFRAAVAAEPAWVLAWMRRPPHTNEVGRANLLLAGLLLARGASRLPVRLFELGASAGLNLRVDYSRLTAPGIDWGPAHSPVHLDRAWSGEPPEWLAQACAQEPALTIVERHGCDPHPVDPVSPQGALILRAHIWPDRTDRLAHLDGALGLAARVPAQVDAMSAPEFLARIQPEHGALTVVWHSVMRQYVAAPDWALVEQGLSRPAAASTPQAPFAYIYFEPPWHRAAERYPLTVRLGAAAAVVPAEAVSHGLPAVAPSGS